VLFVVVLFDVDADYFSPSAFLMTACMDSPSESDKVESSVSSFRILPESSNQVPLWMSLMFASGVGVLVSLPRRIFSFSMLLVVLVLTSRTKGCWLEGILKLILTISLKYTKNF
jgi:hypothetical protein